MNTKIKSLKENFGYLFENAEDFGMSEEELEYKDLKSYKKAPLTMDKDFFVNFSGPKNTASAMAVILTTEFICAKTTNNDKGVLDALQNSTLSTFFTNLKSQHQNYLATFKEFLSTGNSQALFFAYKAAVKLLVDKGIDKILLSEGNITIKKNILQQKLESAISRFPGNTINVQRVYDYFLSELDNITSGMPKSKEADSDRDFKQFNDGKLNLLAVSIYIQSKFKTAKFTNRISDMGTLNLDSLKNEIKSFLDSKQEELIEDADALSYLIDQDVSQISLIIENKTFKMKYDLIDRLIESAEGNDEIPLFNVCKIVYQYAEEQSLLTAVEGDAEEAGEEAGEDSPLSGREAQIKTFNSYLDEGKNFTIKDSAGGKIILQHRNEEDGKFETIYVTKLNDNKLFIELQFGDYNVTPFSGSLDELSELKNIEGFEDALNALQTTLEEGTAEENAEAKKLAEEADSKEPEVYNADTAKSVEELLNHKKISYLDSTVYRETYHIKQFLKDKLQGENPEFDYSQLTSDKDMLNNFKEAFVSFNMFKPSGSVLVSDIQSVYSGEIKEAWEEAFKHKNYKGDLFQKAYLLTLSSALGVFFKKNKSLTEGSWIGWKGIKAIPLFGGIALLVYLMSLLGAKGQFVVSSLLFTLNSLIASRYNKQKLNFKKDPIKFLEDLMSDPKSEKVIQAAINSACGDVICSLINANYESEDAKKKNISASIQKYNKKVKVQSDNYKKLSPEQKNAAKNLLANLKNGLGDAPYHKQWQVSTNQIANLAFDDFMFGNKLDDSLRNKILSKEELNENEIEQMVGAMDEALKDTGIDQKFMQWITMYSSNKKMRGDNLRNLPKRFKSHFEFDKEKAMFKAWDEEWGYQILKPMDKMNKEYYRLMLNVLTGLDVNKLKQKDKGIAKISQLENLHKYSLMSLLLENDPTGDQMSFDFGEQQDDEPAGAEGAGAEEAGAEEAGAEGAGAEVSDSSEESGDEDNLIVDSLTTGAAIAAYLLPWFILNWITNTTSKVVKTVRFAKSPADAVANIANATSGAQHPDFIHKMYLINGKIYTFYYYSTQKFAGTAKALSCMVTDYVAPGAKAALGKAAATVGSVGKTKLAGHNITNWVKEGSVGKGIFMVKGKQVIDVKNGVVSVLEPSLITELTPQSHPALFGDAMNSFYTWLVGSLTLKQKVMIVTKTVLQSGSTLLSAIGKAKSKTEQVTKFKELFEQAGAEVASKIEGISATDIKNSAALYFKYVISKSQLKMDLSSVTDYNSFLDLIIKSDVKTVSRIFILVGKDAQLGQNMTTINDIIKTTSTVRSVASSIDWWAVAAKGAAAASVCAMFYRYRAQRRVQSSENAEAFYNILNIRRLAANDYIAAMLGVSLDREPIPETVSNQSGEDAFEGLQASSSTGDALGSTSVSELPEPSLDEGPQLRPEDRTFEPKFDAPEASTEGGTEQSDGHVREAYHRLRMSDFLFEGVKTRNVASKDKDSIKLAHQRLQSQFRNMFK